jgi:gas vesicle protein
MRNEYEREEASATTKLTYLLIGGGIGAVIALLFAPKSGQELRGDIADATRKGIEKSKETAALVGEKAGDYYEVTRERASGLYQTAQEKASQYKAKAGELTEKAREAAQGANPFSAAIEAGKDAYREEKQRLGDASVVDSPVSSAKDSKVLELPKETDQQQQEG